MVDTTKQESLRDYLTGDAIAQINTMISNTGITQKDILKKVKNLIHLNDEMEISQVLHASAKNVLTVKAAVYELFTNNLKKDD